MVQIVTSDSNSKSPSTDLVDRVRAGWRREFPELDTRPFAVTHRITAISTELNRIAEGVFAEFGVSGPVFDVLAALYAAGRPYALRPSALAEGRVMSTGGMTARLDIGERAGWLDRSRDPKDRRGVVVHLRAKGVELVRRGMAALLSRQAPLNTILDGAERITVDRLMAAIVRGGGPSQDPAIQSPDSVTDFWNRTAGGNDPWLIRFLITIPLLSARIERASSTVVHAFGITPNGFGLLCALRRAGAPYRQTPSDLYRLVILSPAGVTAQLTRMERAGLVSRSTGGNDRRVLPVSLTSSGRDLVEHTIGKFIAAHGRLLDPLGSGQRQELAGLLRRILIVVVSGN